MASLDPKQLGEFGLIEALRRRAGPAGRSWAKAIGDDAALLRPRPGHDIAVTNDALVEAVHFRWRTTDPRALGRKVLAVSLSDIGAMGARPIGFLLTLSLPARTSGARLGAVVGGMLALARRSGCPLVGGDTVGGPVWSLATTVFGEVARGKALGRDGARPGDRLLVAGDLGGSALGLHLLESRRAGSKRARPFVRRHTDPRPPFEAGAVLSRHGWARGAIDVSDGLAQDLGHMLRASGVGARVDLHRLPFPRGLRPLCRELGLDPVQLALGGGEDYALLFASPPSAPPAARIARALGTTVTEIGVVTRGSGADLGVVQGWDHFNSPARRP